MNNLLSCIACVYWDWAIGMGPYADWTQACLTCIKQKAYIGESVRQLPSLNEAACDSSKYCRGLRLPAERPYCGAKDVVVKSLKVIVDESGVNNGNALALLLNLPCSRERGMSTRKWPPSATPQHTRRR